MSVVLFLLTTAKRSCKNNGGSCDTFEIYGIPKITTDCDDNDKKQSQQISSRRVQSTK